MRQAGIILYHQDHSRQERKLLVETTRKKEPEDVGFGLSLSKAFC